MVIVVPAERTSDTPSFGWWDVPVAEVSGSAEVADARRRYERERSDQRHLMGSQ